MSKLWLIPIIWLLSGCVTEPTVSPKVTELDNQIAWPAAPQTARIRYLYSFNGPSELDYRVPLSSRLTDIIGGSSKHTMTRPYAIAINQHLIALSDPGAGLVHLFNTHKETYQTLAAAGATSLASPIGIAISISTIYVADSVLKEVYVFDKRHRLINTLRGFERPTSLAFDHVNNRLYVSDTLAHKVLVFDHQGEKVLSIGERGSDDGKFNYPSHINIANGYLYVNDTMNFRIQKFDLSGNHIKTLGDHGDSPGYLSQPKGLAVNSSGYIFVAEAVANQVQIFNFDGEFLLSFGFNGEHPTAFQMPTGIAISDNKIYVVDSGNRRVQVFEYLEDN